MSSKARKPANRGVGRKPQSTPKRTTGAARSQAAGTTVTEAPRRQSRPQTYPFRDSLTRRKRRQKLVVYIAVAAIVAGGVITVFVGQLGGRSTPTTAAAASTSAAAPTTSAAATAAAGTTTVAAPATGPVMVMSCPTGGGASPVFTHQIAKAATPYSITITYGDGDTYTDTDQHLGAIFSHTYTAKGTYTVDAVLTDAQKQTAAASCTYTW